MKKVILFILSVATVFYLVSPNFVQGAEDKKNYLLAFNTNIDYQLISNFEGEIIREYKYMPVVLVELSEKAASNIRKNSGVLYLEADSEIKATAIESVTLSTQTIPWGVAKINATSAQQEGYTGKGIKVGVIDSGIDYVHNDLNVVSGTNFVKNSIDYKDDNGHGTSVAGIIGALDDSQGIVGVAPQADLYAIKTLDSNGNGYISDVVSGIEWAIDNEMDIVNLSLQTVTNTKTFSKSIKEAYKKGILLVAAAGNKGFDSKGSITYPASYNEVIAVGATDINNEKAFFSSVGKELELMAPGTKIYSTSLNGQYTMLNGTSLASPHVVGVAALLWGVNPQLDNKGVRDILNQTANDIGDSYLFGNGLVDASKAINYSKH